MRTVNVTTEAALVAAGCDQANREWISLENASDTDIYVSFDGRGDTLTTANGMRLRPGAYLFLTNQSRQYGIANNAIYAIHGGSGNKQLRIQECPADGCDLAPAP